MKKLLRALTWCRLLNKRLLKKPAFLAILLLTPLFVFALSLVAAQESGLFTIALCAGRDDAYSEDVVSRLQEQPSLLRWLDFDDPSDARDAVETGRADAAWIFDDDSGQNLSASLPLVTIIEREDNVLLRITREKLFAAMFHGISFQTYSDYLLKLSGGSAEDLQTIAEYYDRTIIDQPIFVLSNLDGTQTRIESNYLLSPARGLMSVMVILSGLAGAVFLQEDRRNRVFVMAAHPALISAAYLLLPMLDMAVVVLAALMLAGLSGSLWYEILLLLLLVAAGSGFCALASVLCKTPERLGAATLFLTLAMLIVCPVFIDTGLLHILPHVFPPTYYLNAVQTSVYCLYLAAYAAVSWGISALLYRLRRKHSGEL